MGDVTPEVCNDGDVRLQRLGSVQATGGGPVQVCYNNQWGHICYINWREQEASVTCRQLGYSPYGIGNQVYDIVAYYLPNILSTGAQAYFSHYSLGLGQDYWLRDVQCSGQEPSLIECGNGYLGYYAEYCSYGAVPSVVCVGE